jgi:hypothetical protein
MGFTVERLLRGKMGADVEDGGYALSKGQQDSRILLNKKMGFLSDSLLKTESDFGYASFVGSKEKVATNQTAAGKFVDRTAPEFSKFAQQMNGLPGGFAGSATGRFLNEFCDGGAINSPACNSALMEFGNKVKTDPAFLAKFNTALTKDPSLAQKMKSNPAEMNNVLKQVTAASPAASAAASTSPAKPSLPSSEPARPSVAPAHPAPVAMADGFTVHQQQAYLEVLGYHPGKLDGISGPRTNTALAAFAEKNGLDKNDIDGINKKLAEQMHDSKEAKTYLAMVKQEIESGKYTKDHVEAAQWAMKEQGADMSHSLKRGKMDGIPGKGTKQELNRVLENFGETSPTQAAGVAAQPQAPAGSDVSPGTSSAPSATSSPPRNEKMEFLQALADPKQVSDKELKEIVGGTIEVDGKDQPFVTVLAGGIRDYADKNFPDLDKYNYSDAFHSKIAGDPKLQSAIAANLQRHPDFVRNIAKMASDEGGADMPDAAKRMAKQELKNLFEKPELLADDKYVESMSKQLKMAQNMKDGGNALGSVGDWFKNNLGMDMGGMMGGIGAFFQQIMSFVQNFMGQITGGNFISMRNSGMDLFGAFKESMNQASMGVENSVREKGYLQVVGPKERADGFMKDKDGNVLNDPKTGKPIEKIVPNTIEVTSINDMKHQVYATTGLNSTRNPPDTKGNVTYNVRVATGLDESGNVSSYNSMVLSKEEYKKYIEEVEKRKPGSMKYDQNYAEVMGGAKVVAEAGIQLKAAQTLGEAATTKVDISPKDGQVGEPLKLKMDEGKASWKPAANDENYGTKTMPTPAQTFPYQRPEIEVKPITPVPLSGA